MDPLRLTIVATPVTKKTHNRTCDIGARCRVCRRGTRTIVLPSENYEDFERAVAPCVQAWWALREPLREPCPRCEGSGRKGGKRCVGCVGGVRAVPLSIAVLVEATVYRERNVGDVAGYIQAIGDVLESAGVLANDRQIAGWPMPRDGGMPLRKDAARPRIEIVITPIDGVQPELPLAAAGG